MNCQHCGNKLPEPVMDGGTCPSCHKNTGLFNKFNLVEELEKSLWRTAFIGQAPEYIEEVHGEVMKEIKADVKHLLPIFAEFIKGIENPYTTGIQSENTYRCDLGFEHLRSIILSELEKYVV